MSRRNLCQPSFVDAMVSGWGRAAGFWIGLEQAFDWTAFEALALPIHTCGAARRAIRPWLCSRSFFCSSATRCLIRALKRRFGDRLSFRRVLWLAL
jgi:hypothetical protein